MAAAWQRLPAPVRAAGERLAPVAPRRISRAMPDARRREHRRPVPDDGNGKQGRRRICAEAFALDRSQHSTARGRAARYSSGSAASTDDPLPATLYVDAQLGLVDDMLHYFDRTSMAHSLEVRVPFLDHEFVELAARIPADLKVRRLQTKHILRETVRGLVPDWVIDKRKVGFFHGAVAGWFEGHASRAIETYVLRPDARYADFLDPTAVRDIVGRAQGRRKAGDEPPALDPRPRDSGSRATCRARCPRPAPTRTARETLRLSYVPQPSTTLSPRMNRSQSSVDVSSVSRTESEHDEEEERDLDERERVVREHADAVGSNARRGAGEQPAARGRIALRRRLPSVVIDRTKIQRNASAPTTPVWARRLSHWLSVIGAFGTAPGSSAA